jgi:hypothetical protein
MSNLLELEKIEAELLLNTFDNNSRITQAKIENLQKTLQKLKS